MPYYGVSGKLVAVTGPDGVGKTTLCAGLASVIDGCASFKFPAPDTAAGKLVKSLLKNGLTSNAQFIQKLNALSRLKKKPDILSAMERGVVICDRYSSDALIYGLAAGCEESWLDQLRSIDVPEDLTICLLGDRHRRTGDSYDRDEKLQARVVSICRELAQRRGWLIIDANKPPAAVVDEALYAMLQKGLISVRGDS